MNVPTGTLVVYADIGCPWAHVCVHRLHETRARLGFAERVTIDLHAFPLELINERPTPKRILDAEIPVAGALEPDAGWQMWQRPDHEYPVTMLPALHAVAAARAQDRLAAEQLDRALRRAFFGESRVVSLITEIDAIARSCSDVDAGELAAALRSGAAMGSVFDDFEVARSEAVTGSPHVFLPDGRDFHNPGTEIHWEGEHGRGFPVVTKDDPGIYEDLLLTAAGEE